jgi:hypothetical protein
LKQRQRPTTNAAAPHPADRLRLPVTAIMSPGCYQRIQTRHIIADAIHAIHALIEKGFIELA